jgi:endoglucanase
MELLKGALLLAGTLCVLPLGAQTVLFEESFDNPEFKKGWRTEGAGGVFDPVEKAVRFTSAKAGADYLIFPLDEKLLRGKRIQLEAEVKGRDLSQSATPYFNSKLKISFDSKETCEHNPEAKRKTGTYDWWKATSVFFVPQDASNVKLTIGLQDVTGSYWVKNLRVSEIPVYQGQPYTASTAPLQKTTKYRGVDTARRAGWSEQDFIDLRKWNVNIIRYQMLPFEKIPIKTREQFSAWIDIEMKKIDAFLVLVRKYGMKAVLDLQVGPGTDNSELGSNRMSWDIKDQDLLIEVWRKMAAHYKGNPDIYAYDVLNEPREDDFVYVPGGGVEWQLLLERAIKAIREIDSDTPILVEATCWSNPNGFQLLKPINGRNLIYSPHFYSPHSYTHQLIYNPAVSAYPRKIGGEYWDKERLRKELEPVVEFQR